MLAGVFLLDGTWVASATDLVVALRCEYQLLARRAERAGLVEPLVVERDAMMAKAASLGIDTRVATLLPSWTDRDRAAVTVRELLEHCSGLPAFRPYFRELAGRDAYQAAIAREPLEYQPRERSIYSDLGFILLGFILEDTANEPLDLQFANWRRAAGIDGPLGFRPEAGLRPRIAATEDDPWRGRMLRGGASTVTGRKLPSLFGTSGASAHLSAYVVYACV